MQTDNITNLNYLKEIAKGDTVFIKEMIGIFLTENPEELKKLERAIKEEDFRKIRLVAHHMKSTIPFIGLDSIIGEDLLNIEACATKKTDIENITILFTKVKAACEKAFHELKS